MYLTLESMMWIKPIYIQKERNGFLLAIVFEWRRVPILVVKGSKWKGRTDYNEILSPTMKMTRIKIVLGIVVTEDLHLK